MIRAPGRQSARKRKRRCAVCGFNDSRKEHAHAAMDRYKVTMTAALCSFTLPAAIEPDLIKHERACYAIKINACRINIK
jgi:ribosomal protein L37E